MDTGWTRRVLVQVFPFESKFRVEVPNKRFDLCQLNLCNGTLKQISINAYYHLVDASLR